MTHTIKKLNVTHGKQIKDYLYEPELWARINEGKDDLDLPVMFINNVYWLGLYHNDEFSGLTFGDGTETPDNPELHICLQKKHREHKHEFARITIDYFKSRVKGIRTTISDQYPSVVLYCEAHGMTIDSVKDGKTNMIMEFN